MGSSFEGNLALAAFLGVVVEKVGLEGVLGQGVKGWCAKTTVKFTGSGTANFWKNFEIEKTKIILR
jgi:hypothetical protein